MVGNQVRVTPDKVAGPESSLELKVILGASRLIVSGCGADGGTPAGITFWPVRLICQTSLYQRASARAPQEWSDVVPADRIPCRSCP